MFPEPPSGPSRLDCFLAGVASLLDSYATRLVLSFLITLSVLPVHLVAGWFPGIDERGIDVAFFCLFAPEFLLRAAVYLWRFRRRHLGPGALGLLLVDLLAVISFLPVRAAFADLAYFRLFRLMRMVLLLGYWGGMVHDLWRIFTARERRYQVVFVLFLGVVLSFAGAVIAVELAPASDYNRDGRVDTEDRQFGRILWWAFLQVQNPDNLVREPTDTVTVVVSLLLTFSGVLLFSFIIGIGTSAIDELMRRSLDRPVGMRNHNVILGLGRYSRLLLHELADIYRKNRRPLRAAVLGPDERSPEYFFDPGLRSFRYRCGDPVVASDLEKLSIADAKRVLVLGTDPDDPDARVVSAVLAARTRAPDVHVYADLRHERNFQAARIAGGPRTHVIGSGSFLGYYLAQNVIFPGISRIYRQLLAAEGCEVYTYVYDRGERRRLAGERPGADPRRLHARAHLEHRVTLLGVFAAAAPAAAGPIEVEDLTVLLNPASPVSRERAPYAYDAAGGLRPEAICGFIAVALCWEDVRGFARSFLERSDGGELPAAPDGFDGIRLELPADPVERLLVCGASARVPRVLRELILYFGRLDITVLIREPDQIERLAEEVRVGVESGFGVPVAEWTARGGDQHPGRELRFPTARGESKVRFLHTDWSDVNRMLRHPLVDFERLDVVLFLPREAADYSGDGLVALDCLRIAQVEQEALVRLKPGFRAIGLVQDPVQADLLERRLDQMSGPGQEARWSIVCGEKLRHDFIVQNVFVPGLSAIYLEILGNDRQHLFRLVPRVAGGDPPPGRFDPWALARHLLLARQLILVGLERGREGGAVETLLDPGSLAPGQWFEWRDVAAVYAVGRGEFGRPRGC